MTPQDCSIEQLALEHGRLLIYPPDRTGGVRVSTAQGLSRRVAPSGNVTVSRTDQGAIGAFLDLDRADRELAA